MSLVQAELERRGIVTASVTMLPHITGRLRPPRALAVPFPLGHPFGEPNDANLQRAVLLALLGLCERDDVPLVERFTPQAATEAVRTVP